MLLDYKKRGTVRELRRSDPKQEAEALEQSRNFTRCGETRTIPIKNILPNPHQPRQEFDKAALQDLAISIMEYGLMQPITVRQIGPFDYELIAGERRLTACRNLGMAYIPAIIMAANATDSAVLALVENIQRENLNYLEEAEAFSNLISEHGLTQEELADKLGKSQSTIANKIRILRLSPAVRQVLTEHNLSERHARALLRLPEEKQRLRAVKLIAERGFNVAKTEELVDKLLQAPQKPLPETKASEGRIFRDMRVFHNTIRQAVDMMRKSGIDASANKTENDSCIEYTIVIPKQ
ncbi:MAG: nucleoid occlusion protein [Clostridia bacterium]|nr:nucleoid occlusion protein [Clostridia bacterium]